MMMLWPHPLLLMTITSVDGRWVDVGVAIGHHRAILGRRGRGGRGGWWHNDDRPPPTGTGPSFASMVVVVIVVIVVDSVVVGTVDDNEYTNA